MWSEPRPRRRWPSGRCPGLANAVLLAVLFAGLAGCGFQPLYAPAAGEDVTPTERLAAVRVDPLPDREGQLLHNFLRDRLNPRGQPLRPAYLLEVRLDSRTQKVGIRKDETATRANLFLESDLILRDAKDRRVLYRDLVSNINSYNILDQPFPTDVAEADAMERGLRELAEDIRLRLAIYFATLDGADL